MPTRTLVHRYAPRNNCLRAYRERVPELLLSGPAGTGKSRALLEKLHTMMMVNPGARGLIVRKTHESMTSTALVTWRDWVVPEALEAREVRFYGGSKEHPAQYIYANGSRVMLGGMDKPSKILSSEYDVIYVQEAIELSETDWETLSSRLRNGKISFQQLMGDTNPDRATHWLNQRATSGRLLMLESRHRDNPRIYADDDTITEYGKAYLGRLDNLTGVRRQRLYLGLWVSADGLTYKEYDPALHVVDPYDVPADWPRAWAIDFGFRHPFAITMWATKPDGELHCYRQLGGTLRTVEDWARAILETVRVHLDAPNDHRGWPAPDPDFDGTPGMRTVVEDGRAVSRETPARTSCTAEDHWKDPTAVHHYRWTEPQPDVILCDHDAEGRETFTRLTGLTTAAADKRVKEGCDKVEQRFKERRITIARGGIVEPDPELREAHKPTCLEEEIPGYQWDEAKDKPVKVMDDWSDTMRYMVAYADLGVRPQLRF